MKHTARTDEYSYSMKELCKGVEYKPTATGAWLKHFQLKPSHLKQKEK